MARVSGFHCARAREEIRRHAYSLLHDFLCVQRIRSRFKDKSLWRMTRAFPSDTKRTGERKERARSANVEIVVDRRSYPASIRFPRSPGTPLRSRPLNRLSRIPSTRRAAPIPIGGRRGRPRLESGASANRWRRASRRRNLSERGSLAES